MLGQYKKIAIINDFLGGGILPENKETRIPLNLTFTPSIIVVGLDCLHGNDFSINSLNETNYSNGVYAYGCVWWIGSMDKKGFDIVVGGGRPDPGINVKSIIAIE